MRKRTKVILIVVGGVLGFGIAYVALAAWLAGA